MADETLKTDSNPDVSEVKPSKLWITDAKGYGSVTATLVFVSFWVTTLAYIASIVQTVGLVTIRPFDVAASGAYFGLCLVTYTARKYTDAKYSPEK
jgi:hypothetical protein